MLNPNPGPTPNPNPNPGPNWTSQIIFLKLIYLIFQENEPSEKQVKFLIKSTKNN